MTATTAIERLRELLDERGVKYSESPNGIAWGKLATPLNGRMYRYYAMELDGLPCMNSYCLTPEQAVAATLGPGTCHDEDPGGYFVCSECGAHVQLHDIGRSYVDEFGKRWYATSHEHGLNYCPNCGRKVADE